MRRLAIFFAVLHCCTGGAAAKIKRVKAGKTYNDHDAVHIVVNKVGYVTSFSITCCCRSCCCCEEGERFCIIFYSRLHIVANNSFLFCFG